MKIIIQAFFILTHLTSFGQPFLGLGATNEGANFQLGFLVQKIELMVAYKMPLTRVDVPTIFSATIGKFFRLSQKETDNYSITPAIGFANCKIKDFTAYDINKESEIITVQDIKPFYSLAAGKDCYLGRIYVAANYCTSTYYEIGIKMFLYR